MNYLSYFFNTRHLLSLRPPAMQLRAVIILAIVFGLMLVVAAGTHSITRKSKDGLRIKGYRRLFNLLMTMGISGFVYLFFAYEGAVLLSARFWLLLWLLITIVWLFFIFRYLKITTPKLRSEIQRERELKKYLP